MQKTATESARDTLDAANKKAGEVLADSIEMGGESICFFLLPPSILPSS